MEGDLKNRFTKKGVYFTSRFLDLICLKWRSLQDKSNEQYYIFSFVHPYCFPKGIIVIHIKVALRGRPITTYILWGNKNATCFRNTMKVYIFLNFQNFFYFFIVSYLASNDRYYCDAITLYWLRCNSIYRLTSNTLLPPIVVWVVYLS